MKLSFVFLILWIARDDSGYSYISVDGVYKNYDTCVQALDEFELHLRRQGSYELKRSETIGKDGLNFINRLESLDKELDDLEKHYECRSTPLFEN